MSEINQMAIDLISQYGDDAVSIAMLRAAEYAASFNTEEWIKLDKSYWCLYHVEGLY